MEKQIIKPEVNKTFFYGSILSYQFRGSGISKSKNKYRIRFSLLFQSGDKVDMQIGGFESQKDAQHAKDFLATELVNKTYIPFQYTFSEFCLYWLYYYKIEEDEIRYETFKAYKNLLDNHIIPLIGADRKLNKITPAVLTAAIRKIQYPTIRQDARSLIRAIFEFAYNKNFIKFNPGLAAYERTKKDIKTPKKRNIAPYSVEEIRLMLYTCKENFAEMYMPLLLSLCLGTRISETLALTYSDIDFTSGSIYINKQIGDKIVLIDPKEKDMIVSQESGGTTLVVPKTDSGIRMIPVPDWILDEILVKRAQYQKNKDTIPNFVDSDLICCRLDGTAYHRKYFGPQFHSLLGMCGLADMRWHDLRHVYASTLKNNKVNIKAISTFLGHASPEFTEDIYIHEKEIAYDCSTLQEEWERLAPNRIEKKNQIFIIPFTNEDYEAILHALPIDLNGKSS